MVLKKLIITLIYIIALNSCFNEETTLRVNLSNNITDLPIIIADKKGFFKDKNIDIKYIFASNGHDVINHINKNELDIGVLSSYVFAISYSDTFKNSIFSTVGYSYSAIQILVRKSSNIKQPIDFIGKKISVVENTQPEFYLHNLFAYYGINPIDIEVKNAQLNFDEQEKSFNDGVEIILTVQPFTSQFLKKYSDELELLVVDNIYRANLIFVANSQKLDKDKDVYKNFLLAIDMANKILMSGEEKDIKKISEISGFDMNLIRYAAKNIDYITVLDQKLVLQMESQLEWYNKRNEIVDRYNVLDLINTNILKEVNPNYVTIIEE